MYRHIEQSIEDKENKGICDEFGCEKKLFGFMAAGNSAMTAISLMKHAMLRMIGTIKGCIMKNL